MTELKGDQFIARVIRVHGIEQPVIVLLTAQGISFRVKGSKKAISQNWTQVVNACLTPGNVPSFLAGKPFEFLKHTAEKIVLAKVKKESK